MEVESESQDKLAQIVTDFERGDSLIIKGNFYQIYIIDTRLICVYLWSSFL